MRYGKGGILWSVGRVQTPVLAMIAAREEEITCFVSKPFWEMKTKYRNVTFSWKGERFLEENAAKELLHKIQEHPFTILDIESKQEKILPPFLYDLTELQKDMNKRYGLSAQETLEQAQKLYEDKYISYPRTDSKYLSCDMKKEMPTILQALVKAKPQDIEPLDMQNLSIKKSARNSLVAYSFPSLRIQNFPLCSCISNLNIFCAKEKSQELLKSCSSSFCLRKANAEIHKIPPKTKYIHSKRCKSEIPRQMNASRKIKAPKTPKQRIRC